jgi:hypothetical protein
MSDTHLKFGHKDQLHTLSFALWRVLLSTLERRDIRFLRVGFDAACREGFESLYKGFAGGSIAISLEAY